MSQGHSRSILPQRTGTAPVDSDTTFLLNFDAGMQDVIGGKMPVAERTAIELKGGISKIEFGDIGFEDFTNCTIEFWAKINNTTNWMLLNGQDNGKYIMAARNSQDFYNGQSGSGAEFYVNGKTGGRLIRDNKWHHYAISGVNLSAWTSMNIGTYSTAWETYGGLSRLRIWSGTVPPEGIQLLYDNAHQGQLLGEWHFHGDDLNIAYDSSGNGRDGIMTSVEQTDGPMVYTLLHNDNEPKRNGVVVESETKNIVGLNRLDFSNDWIYYQGAQGSATQGVYVKEWATNHATRLQTTGGTNRIKFLRSFVTPDFGRFFSESIYVKNQGSHNIHISSNLGGKNQVFGPGELGHVVFENIEGTNYGSLQIQVRTTGVDENVDVLLYRPNVEEGTFSTSFVPDMRPRGYLAYPSTMQSTEHTVSFWLKMNADTSGEQPVFSLRNQEDNFNSPLYIARNANTKRVRVWGKFKSGGYNWQITGPVVEKDVWTHVAVSLSQNRTLLYTNGEEFAGTTNMDISTLPLCGRADIGSEHPQWGQQRVLNGMLDEIRIDKIARQPEEIRAWYYQGRNGR